MSEGSKAQFQSTLPAWGATARAALSAWRGEISIHAPRVGSDVPAATFPAAPSNFNPRSPRGERHRARRSMGYIEDFNPRSPRGERRHSRGQCISARGFQSTLPAWGATTDSFLCPWSLSDFNPRSPRGERQRDVTSYAYDSDFNPRSPRGERPLSSFISFRMSISIHAPRVGSDHSKICATCNTKISIHAPRVGSDRP